MDINISNERVSLKDIFKSMGIFFSNQKVDLIAQNTINKKVEEVRAQENKGVIDKLEKLVSEKEPITTKKSKKVVVDKYNAENIESLDKSKQEDIEIADRDEK